MSLSQESNDLKKEGVQRVFKLLYDYFFVKLKNKHNKKTDCKSVLIKRLKKVTNYANASGYSWTGIMFPLPVICAQICSRTLLPSNAQR